MKEAREVVKAWALRNKKTGKLLLSVIRIGSPHVWAQTRRDVVAVRITITEDKGRRL